MSKLPNGPEGLSAFKVGSRYYVAVANEVSDTTSLFEIELAKGKGKKRAAIMPAPVLEPRRDLRNSSNFNGSY